MKDRAEFVHPRHSTTLMTAQMIDPERVARLSGVYNHDTWGQLEAALSVKDGDMLDQAMVSFEDRLRNEDNAAKLAEAATVLAMRVLYQKRIAGLQPDDTDIAAAVERIAMARGILESDASDKTASYDFELEVLQELLSHGILAFMESPREEESDEPYHNHDLYILYKGNKVPLSVKLGGKSSTRYRSGVRCISGKASCKHGLWVHLNREITELSVLAGVA